jgi:hypothetical protein
MFLQEFGDRTGGDCEAGRHREGQAIKADLREHIYGHKWVHQFIKQRWPVWAFNAIQAETP